MLNREDIIDNVVIIKINNSYSPEMSAEALYEATRGIWKRKIESVSKAEYVLAVANQIVVEAYKVDDWYPAGTIPMKTRSFDASKLKDRIEFKGEVANEAVRNRYIGKSVANLYKFGEADPLKTFFVDDRTYILDASVKKDYDSIYAALNECFGTDYNAWMKATWPGVTGNGKFRVWFPKLAETNKLGELSPAAFDCVNWMSEDGNQIVFDDLKQSDDGDETKYYYGYDLVFAKEPKGGSYIFRGVFVRDTDNSTLNHHVSKKIASRCKVIGTPANDIVILDDVDNNDYYPAVSEYDPGITSERYVELLQDSNVIKKARLDTIYYIYKCGGEASCTQLEKLYGNNAAHFNVNASTTAKCIHVVTNCPLFKGKDGVDIYWPVLFQSREVLSGEEGKFVLKLRDELRRAIEVLDKDGFFEDIFSMDNNLFDHNTILYGPPGTGKTYNTVIYAVAIIENKSVDIIKNEAKNDYLAVKKRYDEYKSAGQIAFTTFHQSYGYEEFIEGISPVLDGNQDTGSQNDIGYQIKPGVFKEFCAKAERPVLTDSDLGFNTNDNPVVWKVSLAGTGDNEIRKECLDNNHIRIGWDSYGPEITDDTVFDNGGKVVLNAFINTMRVGDIVVSCFSQSETDAIGIVTGDYEWDDSFTMFKRVRKVKWLVKGIKENIAKQNGAVMMLASVYRLRLTATDALAIVKKYVEPVIKEQTKKYVFIIDEINRGNISKIFGELITLIENTKRIGMEEETKVILPYSKESFGVPQNVYILGTMNTADRSIAIMDTALRRRFSFIEMPPRPELLSGVVVEESGIKVNIEEILNKINRRIVHLFDREHTIGHAPFMALIKNPDVNTLAGIFEKNVIPLLQEYFYEDYEKIRVILGDNAKTNEGDMFIVKHTSSWDEDFVGIQPAELELPESTYEIKYENFKNINCYKGIIGNK